LRYLYIKFLRRFTTKVSFAEHKPYPGNWRTWAFVIRLKPAQFLEQFVNKALFSHDFIPNSAGLLLSALAVAQLDFCVAQGDQERLPGSQVSQRIAQF